tara:strand:- start:364 stop:1698 length:1335 start_codon:yes stop_codon:yes gene_type:complete
MNINEIRQRIFDQMDFNPNLQQYRDSVVRRINDHYLQICDTAHWLFLQKESTIQLRKEQVGSSSFNVQIETSNLRQVDTTAGTFSAEMVGQSFINTTSNKEFKIVRVKDSTRLFIDANWDGATGSEVQAFKIRFDRQLLPADCIEVLGYVDRNADRGRLFQIERKREEYAYLDRDSTGDSLVIVEDETFEGLVPINNPTLATSGTSGTLSTHTKYEYKYTIYSEGREGPASEATFITTSTSTSINVTTIDNTGWYASSAASRTDSGIAKYLYRRDITNDGPWLLIAILESTTTSYEDTKLYPDTIGYRELQNFAYKSIKDYIHFDESGPRQYVRFWYTPSDDKEIHIRYHRRPKQLVNDNDAPVFPKQYHIILVYSTLEDMFLQMQATDQAQIFRARKLEMVSQMRKRYLSRDDTRKRFERYDRKRTRSIGSASTDFTGASGLP